MNRQFGSSWLEIAVAISVDYEILWRRYVELQAATFELLLQLEQERDVRSWARDAIEEKFPAEDRAA